MKKTLTVAAIAGALAFGVAPAASAGEITGNQKPTPIKERGVAASICAFSGLDDLEESPGTPWTTRPRITQNWGQIPKQFRPADEHPGITCKLRFG